MPRAMARTRGENTPVVSHGLGGADHPPPAGQQQPGDRQPLYLHYPPFDRRSHRSLLRWSVSGVEIDSEKLARASSLRLHSCLSSSPYTGPASKPTLWCLVLLAAGLAIRAAMRRLSSRSPAAPARRRRLQPCFRNQPPAASSRSSAGTPRSSPAAPRHSSATACRAGLA